MEYTGSRTKLRPGDLTAAAARINVPEAALRSVIDVETSGHGFDVAGNCEILFERHRFWKELSRKDGSATPKRDRAEAAGLAYPKWGTRPYPKSASGRWQEFQRACSIDETAAIRSTSWGLGQIMGDEYDECGYTSPQDMVTHFYAGEAEQVRAMCDLIRHRHLDVDMRNFPDGAACRHFAYRYNGSGYKKNRYDTKLAAGYERWKAKLAAPAPAADDQGTLRPGMHGPRVEALQEKLNDRGYHVGQIDGDFGRNTRNAVMAWKMDNDLPARPEVTPEQFAMLDTSQRKPLEASRENATVKDLKGESRIVDTASLVKKGSAATATTIAVAEASGGGDQATNTASLPAPVGNPIPMDPHAVGVPNEPIALDPGALLEHAQATLDKGQAATGMVAQAKDMLGDAGLTHLLGFMHDHVAILAIVAFAAIFIGGTLIEKYRVQMHNDGETD